ncbi:MAG: hypothetical protein Q7S46_08445 [Gallionella sp.]|nr:hypothetical protein [Gallionella sp.]
MMETSKNSKFAQMQGAAEGLAGKPRSGCSQKISPRRIWVICKQEIFYATQHNQPLSCRFMGNLVEWLVVPSVG